MRRGASLITDARGFTLVELLVVVLLLGILAMIALPSFISQRAKGYDAEAQAMVRTAQLALRTYETDNDSFAASRSELEEIEPAIRDATAAFDVSGTSAEFTISEHSHSGTDFTLRHEATGVVTRTCSTPGRGLCRAAPDAAGNSW